MQINPVKQLKVWRTLSDGNRCLVGTLAQNRQGVSKDISNSPKSIKRISNYCREIELLDYNKS